MLKFMLGEFKLLCLGGVRKATHVRLGEIGTVHVVAGYEQS